MHFVGAVALAVLLGGWIGYPAVLFLLRRRHPPGPPVEPVSQPTVEVIIATRDAPEAIRRRVGDIVAGDYPADRLGVIVAVDARSATPAPVVAEALAGTPRVRVVSGDAAGGKAAALNAAVRESRADILVFSDTAQLFDAGAIGSLVSCIVTRQVGGASGYLSAAGDRGALGRFWSYETALREWESDVDSLVGVTGAVYALRRDAWFPLRAGLINDDVAVPLLTRDAGHRVVHCPTAVALDDRVFSRREQFARRVRTLTGLYQLMAWYPWLLVPGRNPLWAQFLCHKGIRLLTPFLVGLVLVGVPRGVLPGLALMAAVALLVGLLAAGLWGQSPFKVLREAAWAVALVLGAPLMAAWNAVWRRWDVWRGPAALGRRDA